MALGDSYSAGVGTRDLSLNRRCSRNPLAYPALVAAERPGTSLSFVACSRARTADVLDHQLGPLAPDTSLVTISIGGNDANFAEVEIVCAASRRPCRQIIASAETFVRRKLAGRLDKVYGQIRRRAPAARVLVVGYPPLFAERRRCNLLGSIDRHEQRELNRVGDLLADVTRARVAAAGFEFVDPSRSFDGHGMCDDEEWLNGVARPISASYHPNPRGYRAYADLVHAAIEGVRPFARVEVSTSCVDTEHVPEEIEVTCDGGRELVALRWSLWTTRRATGHGTAVVNNCWPSCVEGRVRRYPVAIELSRPRDLPDDSAPGVHAPAVPLYEEAAFQPLEAALRAPPADASTRMPAASSAWLRTRRFPTDRARGRR